MGNLSFHMPRKQVLVPAAFDVQMKKLRLRKATECFLFASRGPRIQALIWYLQPPRLPERLGNIKRAPPLPSRAGLGVTRSPGARHPCGGAVTHALWQRRGQPRPCVRAPVPRLGPALSRRAPVVSETLSPPVVPVRRPQIRRAPG